MLTGDGLLAAFDAATPPRSLSPSGFEELDSLTGGMAAGRVWLVVGAPGQGRTTLLTQWAAAIGGHEGQVVHLVTPRDTPEVVTARLLSMAGQLPLNDVVAQRFDETMHDRPVMARSQVRSLNLSLYAHGEDKYVPEVHPWRTEVPPAAVVIDDADLVPGVTPERLGEYAAAGLFVLASLPSHQVLVDHSDEADLRPRWGRTADVVLEVRHRGLPTTAGRSRPGEAELRIRHNRCGYRRTIQALHQAHYSRFIEADT